MKRLLAGLTVVSLLLYGSNTTSKIEASKKHLSYTTQAQKETSKKLEMIAEDIKSSEKEIDTLEVKIDTLRENEAKIEKAFQNLSLALEKAKTLSAKTEALIRKKEKSFVTLVAKQYSVIFAMEQMQAPTRESVISHEVYKNLKRHNSEEMKDLYDEISTLRTKKSEVTAKQNEIEAALNKVVAERQEYSRKKREKEEYLTRLHRDEEFYQKQLNEIVDKQNSLRDTLAELNILHKKEVAKAKREAAARKEAIRLEKERKRKIRLAKEKEKKAQLALRQAKSSKEKRQAKREAALAKEESLKAHAVSEKVRQVHSSYKKPELYRYRGKKTISPIRGAKVVKRFGTYVDPVYKIKIYNESVTLKAPREDAKVMNIINGKVVYAGKSSMLGKVVVVAHSDKLHTVYAGLSKIAPYVEKGRKVKKGYVLGKVKRKLVFQATKNSKHINPLRLIRI